MVCGLRTLNNAQLLDNDRAYDDECAVLLEHFTYST